QEQQAMLDPLTPPEEEQPHEIESKLRSGYTLVYGYVADSITGRPLANVRVHLEKAQADAMTDARGYFEMSVPSPPAELMKEAPPPGLPGIDNIIFELPGYKKYAGQSIDLPEGLDSGWNVELQRGQG